MSRSVIRVWIPALTLFSVLQFSPNEAAGQYQYQNSISLSGGFYAASGFGTNPLVAARYNYFLPGRRFFVEASLGFSSLQSDVLETVAQSQVFESEDLYTYEFVVAYDANPSGLIPYITGGVAGINQGGQNTFSAVLGLGKRIPLPNLFSSDQFSLRYDVRDQIFSQQINSAEPFVAHNIQFSLGLQFYF
jgi:outer membrane beta-barrel protein